MRKKLIVVLILIIFGFVFSGCADDADNNDSRGNAGQDQGQQGQGQRNTYGIDISNWPQGNEYNSFSSFSQSGMYFRKSEDSNAMAINPMGRGDGTNSIPDIYVLVESAGAFPLGTWENTDNNNSIFQALIFTSDTITFDASSLSDLRQVNYTMTDNLFNVSNHKYIPYTPTPEEEAYEADFRSARPWIPATTTISVRLRSGVLYYRLRDNPVMTPFVSHSDIVGTWLVDNFTSDPNTYNPNTEYRPGNLWYTGVRFIDDGNAYLRFRADTDWRTHESNTWTTTTSTYTATNVSNIKTGGIIKWGESALEFIIKEYPSGLHLFVQYKNDYIGTGDKPGYYVFKKAD